MVRVPLLIIAMVNTDLSDDLILEPVDNRRFLSQAIQQKAPRPLLPSNQTSKHWKLPLIMNICFSSDGAQSPSVKRKLAESNLNDDLINKIDMLTDQVVTLNKKYEASVDEIRRMRKSQEKMEKITYTLAHLQKFASPLFLPSLASPFLWLGSYRWRRPSRLACSCTFLLCISFNRSNLFRNMMGTIYSLVLYHQCQRLYSANWSDNCIRSTRFLLVLKKAHD